MNHVITRLLIDVPWILAQVLLVLLLDAEERERTVPPPPDLTPAALALARAEAALETTAGQVGVALPGPGPERDDLLRAASHVAATSATIAEYLRRRSIDVQTYGAERVRFRVGSAELDQGASRRALDEMCSDLLRRVAVSGPCPIRLEVEGHTDLHPFGTSLFENVALSSERALRVATWLQHTCLEPAGIQEGRVLIGVRGSGPWDPLDGRGIRADSNRRDAAVMQANRRVCLRYRAEARDCSTRTEMGEP